MRIVVIGASGTIGKAVVAALAAGNEVVAVGKSSGDFRVDLGSKPSIEALFKSLGRIDAVVSAAGEARFGPLDALSDDDFAVSLGNKLMGQVNLVRVGHPFVADGGSLTLTSGVLAQRPMPGGCRNQPGQCGPRGVRPRRRAGTAARHSGQRRQPAVDQRDNAGDGDGSDRRDSGRACRPSLHRGGRRHRHRRGDRWRGVRVTDRT